MRYKYQFAIFNSITANIIEVIDTGSLAFTNGHVCGYVKNKNDFWSETAQTLDELSFFQRARVKHTSELIYFERLCDGIKAPPDF